MYRPRVTRSTPLLRLLIKWLVLAGAFWLADALLSDMHVAHGFVNLLIVAAIFGLVNAILGPILRLLSAPITFVTLGLFAFVVNAALLGIAAAFTSRLSIDGFWTAMAGALIISVVSIFAELTLEPRQARGRRR